MTWLWGVGAGDVYHPFRLSLSLSRRWPLVGKGNSLVYSSLVYSSLPRVHLFSV